MVMYRHDKDWTGGEMGERWPGKQEREDQDAGSEYARRWKESMSADDVPGFTGEWGYGDAKVSEEGESDKDAGEVNDSTDDAAQIINAGWDDLSNLAKSEEPQDWEAEWQDGERTIKDELSDAASITSFGFDTASRIYGLNTVINAIVNTDETVNGARNPLGAIYQVIAPTVEDRAKLYKEIRKDRVRDDGYNTDSDLNDGHGPLGFTRSGDFYDKSINGPEREQRSIDAIRAVRRLVEILENDERFDRLREKAYERDQTVIEQLVDEIDRPTISQLLTNIDAEVSDGAVDEILSEVEQKEDENETVEKASASNEVLGNEEPGNEVPAAS